MARDKWFETVSIAQERAKKRLPKSAYSALLGASEKGVTVSDNVESFAELGFAPHVIGALEKRDLATTVMGQDISLPVIISPTGVQAVHPDGEVAVARAAAARGTAMGLSSFASKPIEEVVAVNGKVFFQIYWLGGRDAILERVQRAKEAGAVGLIATTDWSFSHGRDWGSPKIPEQMNLRTMLKMAPEVITKPRWLWDFGKTISPPDLRVPNQGRRGEAGPPFFQAYGEWMGTPPPTWEDIAWLRDQWDAPFMLKGIVRVDDAKRAVDAGVSAISVSNHGGNNLDGTPAAIRCLPAVAAAVGDQVEVLLDGGIRRGSDVVKALALGARAVMIGRAYLWGLAAEGQPGVENVLDLMRGGIDCALMGLGKASIHDLGPDDILIPPSFARALGVPSGVSEAGDALTVSGPPAPCGWDGRGGRDGRDEASAADVSSAERIATQTPTIGAQQVNSAYHRRVAFPNELGNSTARQLRDLSPALIIPLGSIEQHGPHLPLDTDTRIASAVAQSVAERLGEGWLLAPAIGYGASGEHQGFPGTISIGTSALQLLLVEYGRSACDWASRLAFVNGHGGNVRAVAAAAALLRQEGRDVAWSACSVPGADAHAGHTETSVLLHISPDAVHIDEWVPGNEAPLSELMPRLRSGGVAAVSPVGVLGNPTTASAAEGRRIFAQMVDSCTRRMSTWTPDSSGMLQ